MKLLEERARIAELEAEATLMMEQQKAETQAKMFQLQREVVRAKARAQVYAGYTKDDETKTDITEAEHKDEVTLSRHQRNSKHSQPHSCMKVTDTSQPNNKGDDRVKKSMKQKNSAASNLRALKDDGADSEMAQMMSKLLRQQAAPEVDIDVFTGDPTEYHYFLVVFEEVVEKKIDDARGMLTRLIKYTGGEPKEMIKHCIQQPANTGYKNARSLLEQKYGNPHSIIAAYRREIKTWPQLKPADGAAFQKLHNFLIKCESATYGQTWNALDTPEMMCLVLSKLPGHTRERWNRSVMSIRRRYSREPDFADLIHFVEDEATLVNDPLFSKEALSGYVDKREVPVKKKQLKTYAITANENASRLLSSCPLCQRDHDLDKCEDFMKKSIEERSKFLARNKLCYGCYMPISSDHNARSYKQRRVCTICKEKHPTGLHGYKHPRKSKLGDNSTNSNENSMTCATTKVESRVVSMCIVPVKVRHVHSGREIQRYAMLDCRSQGTFINTDLARKLKADGIKATIKIKTLNGEDTQESEAISGLKVSKSIGKPVWIDLPVTHSKTDLPVGDEDVVTPNKIKEWKYLEEIADEITQTENISIGILIGGNCSKALEPREVIPSKNGGPYAFRTLLGWCIVGPVGASGNDVSVACNRVAVQDLTSKAMVSHYFAVETEVKDIGIEQMLHKMYSADLH